VSPLRPSTVGSELPDPAVRKENLMTTQRKFLKIAALAIAISGAGVVPALADTVVQAGSHHYIYFGDHDIYYAPETKTYFWLENGRWQSGYNLPQDYQRYVTTRGMEIDLDTDRPYERNDFVIAHYRNPQVTAAAPVTSETTTQRAMNPDGSTTTTTTTTTTQHRYVYYGDRDIYFAPDTGTYFWQDNGRWVSGATLPTAVQPYVRSGGVDIVLDTERPYERNAYVIAHYGHRHDGDRHHDDDD
jgi:hypothetical protein